MALETPDAIHACGTFVGTDPVPAPFTSAVVNSNGFAGFTRQSAGVYELDLEQGLSLNESVVLATQPANQLGSIGAQLNADGSAVVVTTFDVFGVAADMPLFYVQVLRLSLAGLPINVALPPVPVPPPPPSGGGALPFGPTLTTTPGAPLAANFIYPYSCAFGSFTVNPPAAPADKDRFGLKCVNNSDKCLSVLSVANIENEIGNQSAHSLQLPDLIGTYREWEWDATGGVWRQLGQAHPVLPDNYVTGFQLSYTDATHVSVAKGKYRVFDFSLNAAARTVQSLFAHTIDTSAVGVGGLDVAGPTNSSFYYVYAVAGTAGVGVIASLNSPMGAGPAGYSDSTQQVGSFAVDSAGNIIPFDQRGNGNERTYQYRDNTETRVLSGGAATIATGVSCLAVLPAGPAIGYFEADFTNGAGANAYFGVSANTAPNVLTTFADSSEVTGQFQCPTAGSVQYRTDAPGSSVELWVTGYQESL